MNFKIAGTGSYVPQRVVTNQELTEYVDTNDEWIVRRVGIKERRVSENETAADLAFQAALRALKNAKITASELDLIICATISGETVAPSVASMTQRKLGATCPAFDVNSACSGFLFALDTAAGYFARGIVKKVLVIGAERLSRLVDWTDRSTCVIFGDGAGAAVLEEGDGYLASKLYTSGGDEVIKIPNFTGSSPFYSGEVLRPYISMDGQETFKFAVNTICADIREIMEKTGLSGDDIGHVVLHQANVRIIDLARKHLPEIAGEKFFVNISKYGNTSSASIPIALDELFRSGEVKEGENIVMCAFGGGLSSAVCAIRK